MPNNYYPSLGELVSFDHLPSGLGFASDFLDSIFYKNLQIHKSKYGEKAFYHIEILTDNLSLKLGDNGFELFINPNDTATSQSVIPISFFYQWEILKYINQFEASGFAFDNKSFFNLILNILKISKDELLRQSIDIFIPDSNGITRIEAFITAFNNTNTQQLQPTTDLTNLIDQLGTAGIEVYELVFSFFIEGNVNPVENIQKLFSVWLGPFSFSTLKNIIIPNFGISLDSLELALAFPRTWLKPVNPDGTLVPGDSKSMLTYYVGSLIYDSKTGFDFIGIDEFALTPSQIGNTGLILELEGIKLDLKSDSNIPEADADGRPNDFKGVFAKKVAITLPAKWFKDIDNTTAKISGQNLLIGTGGISGMLYLQAIGGDNTLWTNIGSSDGFKVGFSQFDISFKQNKVISSNIKGALEIKKFVYPNGATYPDGSQIPPNTTVRINIDGHLSDDGDFNLTASAQPPYPIEFPNVFTYRMKSVELGKEDDDFYIGTSGTLQFEGFLKDTLNLGPIEIERLRIYSDGSIEFKGGSVQLINPIILPLGPVEITVSAIHYGSHQKEVNGVMRKFNYFGFDGGVSIDPLGCTSSN